MPVDALVGVGDVNAGVDSGGPHSAAPSNSVDEVESCSSGVAQSAVAKQLSSHAGRVLNTGSSDTTYCYLPGASVSDDIYESPRAHLGDWGR